MRLPIGTKLYDSDTNDSYWLVEKSTFEGFSNNKLVSSYPHDKYPQWLDSSDWGNWRIEFPKESLFDQLYKRMK